MGMDTKGAVITACKDAFFAIEMVEAALNGLIQPHLPKFPWQTSRRSSEEATADAVKPEKKAKPDYAKVKVDFKARDRLVKFNFTYAGEQRMLWLFFDCDSSNVEFGPKSLTLSMGCWGQSDLFMKTALQALSPLGPVYFDHNDCDDIDKALWDISPLTFVSACQKGLVSAGSFDLENWNKLYTSGGFGSRSVEEVFGMSENKVKAIIAAPYEDSRALTEAICAITPPDDTVVP